MRNCSARYATRADAQLDAKLTAEQCARLADQLDGGLSAADAVRLLFDEHGIKISKSSVTRWAAKRRRAKSDLTFSRLLEDMRANAGEASALDRRDLDLERLQNANLHLLSNALFEACRHKDLTTMMQASRMFSQVLGVVARNRRAEASALDAMNRANASAQATTFRAQRVQVERDRHDFDPERAATEHQEALSAILGEPGLTDKQKVARASDVIFGRTPPPKKTPPEAKPEETDK